MVEWKTIFQSVQLWFYRNPILDTLIRTNFLPIWEKAVRGECDHWTQMPRGALALVLLLDQFSRNMFRDTLRMFDGDKKAAEIVDKILENRLENTFPFHHRSWFYLVYTRPEDPEKLRKALTFYEELGPRFKRGLEFLRKQLEILTQFGRYPHRNEMLGRKSTKEEIAFMNSGERFAT